MLGSVAHAVTQPSRYINTKNDQLRRNGIITNCSRRLIVLSHFIYRVIIKYVLVIFTANLHIFFHLDVIGSRLLMPFTKKRGLFVQKSVLWAPKAFSISKKR